jgi:hypothetical protein
MPKMLILSAIAAAVFAATGYFISADMRDEARYQETKQSEAIAYNCIGIRERHKDSGWRMGAQLKLCIFAGY